MLEKLSQYLPPALWHQAVVVSFPKAGRTWLRVMLDEGAYRLSYTHAGSAHKDRKHLLQMHIRMSRYAEKKVVFMLRDPRDTVVSGFYQASKRLCIYGGSMSEFIRDPRHGIEKIIRFQLQWLHAKRHLSMFHFLEYESLQTETEVELRKLLEFLGYPSPSQDQMESMISKGSFRSMQQQEGQKKFGTSRLRPRNPDDVGSYKARKGKVGGYLEELSAEDVQYCDRMLQRYFYWEQLEEFRSEDAPRDEVMPRS